jgi:UDP-N-acetylglucosamine:LPS N-acetylglucosamine transferase
VKKIAIFTGPEGHLSIAEAIGSMVKDEYKVVTFFEQDPLFSLYIPIYQFFPMAYKIPFTLSQFEPTQKALFQMYERRYRDKLNSFLKKHKPDFCIGTFYMYSPILEQYQQDTGTPFINIITDPRTIHPMLISSIAHTNLVFDEDAAEICRQLAPARDEQPAATIQVSGWFVRPRFQPTKNVAEARRRLGLNPDLPTILITAGSEGTTMILKLVPALFSLTEPTQVIVTCGNNKALFNSVKTAQRLFQSTQSASKIIPLQFVSTINEYMQAADIIVGKAGPNTLFESVATYKPFLAITHISGQEDGNLDIIREKKLGWVEENPLKASRKLHELINNLPLLTSLQPDILKMANHNLAAKKVLLKVLSN